MLKMHKSTLPCVVEMSKCGDLSSLDPIFMGTYTASDKAL